jgi:hypothetical protein
MQLLALSAVRKLAYGIFFKNKENYSDVDYRLYPWKEAGDLAGHPPNPVIWKAVFADKENT